jgi:hypothetical protein
VLALGLLLVPHSALGSLMGLLCALAAMAMLLGLAADRQAGIPWSLLLLGGAYAVSLIGRASVIDALSLPAAGLIFLAAQLGSLSLSAGPGVRSLVRPLSASLVVILLSSAAGVMILGLASAATVAGPVVQGVGAAAALAAIALVGMVLFHRIRG